jgi:hypothetical protein
VLRCSTSPARLHFNDYMGQNTALYYRNLCHTYYEERNSCQVIKKEFDERQGDFGILYMDINS